MDFRIKVYFRTRMYTVLKKYFKKGLLPKKIENQINWVEVCEHLKATKPDDYDTVRYQIDHKRPLCSYDLADPEQLRQANHYTNLQWLTAKENLEKGGRWEKAECKAISAS